MHNSRRFPTTRRQFCHTLGAAAVAITGMPRLGAATYDYVIKGGRVIDPGQRIDRILDVAISLGRIAAVRENIAAADASEVIDAKGRVVTPGLIDVHAHLRTGEMPPSHCLAAGVTSMVDGGSYGADNIDQALTIAGNGPNRVRILLNLARQGMIAGAELLDLSKADVPAARKAIAAHRDLVVGVKARLSETVAGKRDLDVVRLAREVVAPFKLPIMVHIGQTVSPLSAIFPLLQPGDIVTHIYAPPPNDIFDERGRILPTVHEARKRGIVFDIGHGRVKHITWDMAERAITQNLLPDTISTDISQASSKAGVFDLPTTLSKFLMLGLPLPQVIAMATSNAARVIPGFESLGTLRVGRPADVAVFDLAQGEFEFVDNDDTKRIGKQKLVTHAVVMGGTRVK